MMKDKEAQELADELVRLGLLIWNGKTYHLDLKFVRHVWQFHVLKIGKIPDDDALINLPDEVVGSAMIDTVFKNFGAARSVLKGMIGMVILEKKAAKKRELR